MIKYAAHEFHIERENQDGTISFIPYDLANSDYQGYLRWLENPNDDEQQAAQAMPQPMPEVTQ